MTISLNDSKADFMYNGLVLENEILKDLMVSKIMEKVKLKVVEPQPEERWRIYLK